MKGKNEAYERRAGGEKRNSTEGESFDGKEIACVGAICFRLNVPPENLRPSIRKVPYKVRIPLYVRCLVLLWASFQSWLALA